MSPSVVEQIRDELVAGTGRFELRRRRVRAAGVAVLVVVALAAGSLAWSAERAGGPKVLVQPETTSTTATVPAPPLARGPIPGLDQLPSAPAGATRLTPVWTGRDLLFVGAVDEEGTVAAYAYAVDQRRWRNIALPPEGIGSGSAAVWTGTELVVCCGAAPRSDVAAAYDPASDSWHRVPNAPVHGYTTAVWTGTDAIFVAPDGVAAFDPDADAWTLLPVPAELASFNKSLWIGHALVVWPAPGSRSTHRGELWNPETRTWTTLPAPPERSWPAMPDITWVGDSSFVVIGGLPAAAVGSERLVGSRYDFDTNEWSTLAEPLPEPDPSEGNLGSQSTLWTDRYLLMYAGALASGASPDGALLAYDPDANSWKYTGVSTTTALRPIVMAGDRVLLERGGNYYLSVADWDPPSAAH